MSDLIDNQIKEVLREELRGELRKLVFDIVGEKFKEHDRKLDNIQEVVDKTRTELVEHGKDLTANTIATKNLKTEFEAYREDSNAKEKRLHEKVSKTVSDSITETVPGAVEVVLEPKKHRFQKVEPKTLIRRILERIRHPRGKRQ